MERECGVRGPSSSIPAPTPRPAPQGFSEHHGRLLRYVGLGDIQAARRSAEDG